MYPCHVCGSSEIDTAGYCGHCRVYRGVVSYESAPPAGTVYGAGYEDGHAAVDAAPVSAPARSGRSVLVPLFVATVVAFLLTLGTLVALVIRGPLTDAPVTTAAQDPATATPSPAASSAPSAAPALDNCVMGTWKVVSSLSQVILPDDRSMTMTSGKGGGSWRFSTDGSGTYDLGGITYAHEASGTEVVGTGNVAFTARSEAGAVILTSVKANAVYTNQDGGPNSATPLLSIPMVFQYLCGDNSLVLTGNNSRFDLRRG